MIRKIDSDVEKKESTEMLNAKNASNANRKTINLLIYYQLIKNCNNQ